jgi:hypothetical protein
MVRWLEANEIAAAAAVHGPVTGVLAAESASGRRSYLLSLGEDDAREWLVVDEQARPVDDRSQVREVASLVAMCELAAEAAEQADEARVASPAYLDAVGSPALGSTVGVVEAFVADVEGRYRLPLR